MTDSTAPVGRKWKCWVDRDCTTSRWFAGFEEEPWRAGDEEAAKMGGLQLESGYWRYKKSAIDEARHWARVMGVDCDWEKIVDLSVPGARDDF